MDEYLEEALKEVELIRRGKLQKKTAREFLNELKEDENKEDI
jgi:hypothetical protein